MFVCDICYEGTGEIIRCVTENCNKEYCVSCYDRLKYEGIDKILWQCAFCRMRYDCEGTCTTDCELPCKNDCISGLTCNNTLCRKKFCLECFVSLVLQNEYCMDADTKEIVYYVWKCKFCDQFMYLIKNKFIQHTLSYDEVIPDCTICGTELCGDDDLVSDDLKIGLCGGCKN